MPETTEEPELHNGHQPQAESESESKLEESQSESEEQPGPEEELKMEPVATDADPNPMEDGKESSVQSDETAKPSSTDQSARPLMRKDEGNRTFTMRELLPEFKSDEDDAGSPYSPESTQRQSNQNSAAMELVNSVTGADEEGQSRQRVLVYAAKRYATALEKNPEDYDALYNWALALQESADNVSPDSTSPSKDSLLEEACKKYEEATRFAQHFMMYAFYNWAIAISDRAKMRGRTKEAEELWEQELSAIVPAREKQNIVRTAISKFRAAIRLQFDFHRAIYNLGTVLYGLAEDSIQTGSTNPKDVSPDELYSQSAIYIAAAHALKPNYSVYSSALRLVRSMLKAQRRNLVMNFVRKGPWWSKKMNAGEQ
ncbi:hypothetical protein V6N12_012851 [Hibiscus sabdariffa]|uniref:Uncharacterized protein n=1 Tax=Hibiscus sabdariffa TaxID=183260 RepID=A0ABR2EFL4_9ROSI